MTENDLTQSEAQYLLELEKERATEEVWDYPHLGGSVSIPLTSVDRRESFLLDLSRARIKLSKMKFQNRARQSIPLVRLDIDGPAHRNPDGNEIPCPHLHVYKEGFGLKWAYPVPPVFSDLASARTTLCEFQAYCKIVRPPVLRFGLFT